MSKKTHQIFYSAIIINLIFIINFSGLSPLKLMLCGFSLFAMIMLPFGKKGSMYHRILSSAGFTLYLMALIIVN